MIRCAIAALVGVGLSAAVARADGPLDPAVLKKLKAGTVQLEVKLPDGKTAFGSGFFTEEPGVVITNAHVLGLRDADSRKPVRVHVTVNSGEPNSRKLPATFLGGDRGTDLAVLRVTGNDLPD